MTFWCYVDPRGPPREDGEALGRLVRRLHSLETPLLDLPAAKPLSSLYEDAERCEWLDEVREMRELRTLFRTSVAPASQPPRLRSTGGSMT